MGGDGRVRRARRMAMMCTAIGLGAMMLAPLARPARATPTEGGESAASAERSLEAEGRGTEEGKAAAVFYPPQNGQASPRPVTVLLHGLCGDPRRACAPFVDASTARGWLVCPRGEDSCEGGSRWRLRPEDDARRVEESLGAVARDRAGQATTRGSSDSQAFRRGSSAWATSATAIPLTWKSECARRWPGSREVRTARRAAPQNCFSRLTSTTPTHCV